MSRPRKRLNACPGGGIVRTEERTTGNKVHPVNTALGEDIAEQYSAEEGRCVIEHRRILMLAKIVCTKGGLFGTASGKRRSDRKMGSRGTVLKKRPE